MASCASKEYKQIPFTSVYRSLFLSAFLAVLKSDNANGLFGFSGACTLESPEREDTLVHCPVERRRGDADFVTLDWVVEQRSEVGGRLSVAAADFRNATGQLVFNPGERRKVNISERRSSEGR